MPKPKDNRTGWVLAFVAPMACAIAFGWPTLDAPFQPGDDFSLILQNPLVRDASLVSSRELLTSIHSDLYQPLPMLSFQANHAAAGDAPLSYHIVNIALHVACTLLAALLAWRLSREPAIACLTGVLFAMHPLAMDAVGWISGRILLMAAFFSLALLNLIAHRTEKPGAGWTLASLLAGIGMLLSKVIPGVPFAAAWVDASAHPPTGTLRERPKSWWAVMAALMTMTAAMTLLATQTARTEAMAEAAESLGVPAGVRMLLALRYYIENYFVPTHLTVWSPVPRDAGWNSPGVLIVVAEAAALFALAWLARRAAPVITAGIGLFALLLLPFLAAVGVRNFLTADRYMYLPMAGLHLATAAAMVGIWRFVPRPSLRVAMRALLLAAFCGLILIDRREAAMRRDIVAVAQRAMALHPNDVRIPVKLAKIYNETRRSDDALATIADARRHWPDDPALAGEAGVAQRMLGDMRAAEAEFRRAITGQSDDLRAKYHLALTLDDLNQPDEAAALYLDILKTRDDYVPASTALARNYRRAGKQAEALALFDRALQTNPRHRNALRASAEVLLELKKPEDALDRATRLLEQDPRDVDAGLLFAKCLADLNRYQDAEATLRGLLATAPARRDVLLQLHAALLGARKFEAAVDLWKDAQKAEPRNTEWAARLEWVETLRQIARAVKRPPDAVDDSAELNLLIRFTDGVRRGHAESPTRLALLTTLKPADSPAEHALLSDIIQDLGYVAAERPTEPVLYYATSVALALRGEARLARLMRNQLPHDNAVPEWAEPIAALDRLLAASNANTQPATP